MPAVAAAARIMQTEKGFMVLLDDLLLKFLLDILKKWCLCLCTSEVLFSSSCIEMIF